jgi:hypothetical protein
MQLDLMTRWNLALAVVATVAAIVVLVGAVLWIRSWLRENEDSTVSPHELLFQYREMLREGQLSDEEFRLIKGELSEQMGLPSSAPNEKNQNA